MTTIRRLSTGDRDFDAKLDRILTVSESEDARILKTVGDIIDAVRTRGDEAVLEYTERFDHLAAERVSDLEIPRDRMQQSVAGLPDLVREALTSSIARVRKYHEEQKRALGGQEGWTFEDDHGNRLGQRVRPIEKAGVYVPGGKATYPSSVIMTCVPARVAGVGEIVLMVPAPDGEVSELLLATAALCGVDRLFRVGGAQAVAALAYGTRTIPRVDKIVGPGNIYVATAKKMVFGKVGIDMIAGPSEVVVVADDSASVEWLVMDLFAQAEHDEMAQAILISADGVLLDRVAEAVDERLEAMQRADIIRRSVSDRGALIQVRDSAEAMSVVNRIAPEHLELAVRDPESLLGSVKHAGAIFLGHHSAEVVGDYSAGPSHVLPTAGSARFASPLGVYDFQVSSSLIQCSPRGSVQLCRAAAILAREEGLEAHALSAEYRVEG